MNLSEFFRPAKQNLTIVGTHPLSPYLEESAQLISDLLILNSGLQITILCESDSENFSQSLILDDPSSSTRTSHSALSVHRDRILGTSRVDGLYYDVERLLRQSGHESTADRLRIRQLNLRLPLNIISVDGDAYVQPTLNKSPSVDRYRLISDEREHEEIIDLIDFYINPKRGGIFLSRPGEELIELYDRGNIPRGIFPRSAFYNTSYKRYSVWGFIFNREGRLLLHRRSGTTTDGRNLWDKSVGGHVDLRDSSTSITVKRELIEELFLPEAEHTKYMRADLGDIINFGDWIPKKRPEKTYIEAFLNLGRSDWVMFRATNSDGDPLTIDRISERLISMDDETTTVKRTVFITDVYFFIAPRDLLDTDEQMKRLLGAAEERGAANDHRLTSISELRDWIESSEIDGSFRSTFTDDLAFINMNHRDTLERFSEFIKLIERR